MSLLTIASFLPYDYKSKTWTCTLCSDKFNDKGTAIHHILVTHEKELKDIRK